VFDDHATIGKIDMIGNLTGEVHFMGNQNTGHAVGRQFLDSDQNLIDRLRVKGSGHFIKQHHLRVHRQGPGNGVAIDEKQQQDKRMKWQKQIRTATFGSQCLAGQGHHFGNGPAVILTLLIGFVF